MFENTLKSNHLKIFIIILISILIDNLYIFSINNPPAWDQGYHLTNAFKMSNILDIRDISFFERINELLNVTNSYRGPFTYFISSLFLKISKNNYHFAYLSNSIFNLICIISIFHLGKLFKNESTGIWASIIFSFSSFIIIQRSDYLIDLSLTSFCILNLLFLSKWYIEEKKGNINAIFSGISFGFIFLVKPTGIISFILPISVIFIKLFRKKAFNFSKIYQILFFFLSFLIIIYPWFSKHWLTIITSTINAWNWGIKYQDGFEKTSINNWLYYLYNIPVVFGIINFSVVSIIFLFDKFLKKNAVLIRDHYSKKINIWFYIYIFNSYLILSLMSTKDLRFLLPVYPLFCIYLSSYINTVHNKYFSIFNKKFILIISISISLIFNNGLNFSNFNSNFLSIWPHSQIINEIENKNLNLKSTLAILPDTKEINTFNLEAEASRQGEYVSVRQIVSNKDSYKEDLKYFDWFLVKTGDQGEMTNESKNLLNQYLLDNPSFVTHKEWTLNDESNLKLVRRKTLNTSLIKNECLDKSPTLGMRQIDNGIQINISGEGKYLKSGNLLLNFIGSDFEKSTNISLANDSFHRDFDIKSCYSLSQNIEMNLPNKSLITYDLNASLLTKYGNIIPIKMLNNKIEIDNKLSNSSYIPMLNKISKVELLGIYLKKGQYKNLFDLVGIINQSDPEQKYLMNAEKIYIQRYKENNNLNNLYSVLISQILQKKISQAEKTINLILKSEKNNGNAYLAKAIINLYLFDTRDAKSAIESSKSLKKSIESDEILNIAEGINYLLEMNFINAYKILS
tara:strand:- start:321 stop:2708 length:2388 start_codon:yes stop_codon:yes gene_type:complete